MKNDKEKARAESEAKVKAIEKKGAMETYDRELKMFRMKKYSDLAQVAISTSVAVMRAIAGGGGLPWGAVFGAITGAIGAAQAGIILAQPEPAPPQFKTGGVLQGGSAGVDTIDAKVSQGEAIIDQARTKQLFDFLDSAKTGTVVEPVNLTIEGNVLGNEEFLDSLSETLARRVEGNEAL